MTNKALDFISKILTNLSIPYEFMEWKGTTIPYPYWVGEYIESPSDTFIENGLQEFDFILTGTGSTWLSLNNDKEKIKNNINQTAILDNNNGIAVTYSISFPIPTNEDGLKRVEIHLNIKEWSTFK